MLYKIDIKFTFGELREGKTPTDSDCRECKWDQQQVSDCCKCSFQSQSVMWSQCQCLNAEKTASCDFVEISFFYLCSFVQVFAIVYVYPYSLISLLHHRELRSSNKTIGYTRRSVRRTKIKLNSCLCINNIEQHTIYYVLDCEWIVEEIKIYQVWQCFKVEVVPILRPNTAQ